MVVRENERSTVALKNEFVRRFKSGEHRTDEFWSDLGDAIFKNPDLVGKHSSDLLPIFLAGMEEHPTDKYAYAVKQAIRHDASFAESLLSRILGRDDLFNDSDAKRWDIVSFALWRHPQILNKFKDHLISEVQRENVPVRIY